MTSSSQGRHPRKWLVAWTYETGTREVAIRLEEEVKPHFPELLEVFVPTYVNAAGCEVPSVPGYVFLRVVEPKQEFLDAVLRVPGIGAFLQRHNESVLSEKLEYYPVHIPDDLAPVEVGFRKPEVSKRGVIISGPLKGLLGLVTNITPACVEVRFGIFDRILTGSFQHGEVAAV